MTGTETAATISSLAQAYFLKGLLDTPLNGFFTTSGLILAGDSPEAPHKPIMEVEESGSGRWHVISLPPGIAREHVYPWLGASSACGLFGGESKLAVLSEAEPSLNPSLLSEMEIGYERHEALDETPLLADGWATLGPGFSAILSPKAVGTEYSRRFDEQAVTFAYISAFLRCRTTISRMKIPKGDPAARDLSPYRFAWPELCSFVRKLSYGTVEIPELDGWDWDWVLPEEQFGILEVLPAATTPATRTLADAFFAYRNMTRTWVRVCRRAGFMPAVLRRGRGYLTPVFPEVLGGLGRKWGVAGALASDVEDGSIFSSSGGNACTRLTESVPLENMGGMKHVPRHARTDLTEQLAAALSVANELMWVSFSGVWRRDDGRLETLDGTPYVSDTATYPDDPEPWFAVTCPSSSNSPEFVGKLLATAGKVGDGTCKIAVLSGDWDSVSSADIARTTLCLTNAGVQHVCDMTGRFASVPNLLEHVCELSSVLARQKWVLPEKGTLLDAEEEALLLPLKARSYAQKHLSNKTMLLLDGVIPDVELLSQLSLGRSSIARVEFPPITDDCDQELFSLFSEDDVLGQGSNWKTAVDELTDLARIWSGALTDSGLMLKLSGKIVELGVLDSGMLEDTAEAVGIAPAIESYYAGVPLKDVLG